MTISTQEYANLAQDAYNAPQISEKRSRERREIAYQDIKLDGVTYEPLEYLNNPATGYQGTIYQRKDTGEIVVAHRGTEPPGKDPQDAFTDAGMVFKRVNAQAVDAEKLTQHALERAREYAEKNHKPTPEVTITGHSLGGALTQITASKSGLHGVTFNAYGVASLNVGIPQGGDSVINHVMATDPVSAASRHFGQERVYATEGEVKTLAQAGYSNDRVAQKIIDAAMPPGVEVARTMGTAVASLGSHRIGNFATIDEQGRTKPSVLTDPRAQPRAEHNTEMIQHYRSDVQTARATLSVMSDVAITAEGVAAQGASMAKQGYNSASKTVSEGINAAQQKAGQAVTRAQKTFLDNALHLSGAANQALDRVGLGPPGSGTHTRQPSPEPTPTPARGTAQPGAPLDPRHPQHPDHALDQSMRQRLQNLNATQGITLTPRQLDNCTAALMADARAAGMRSVASMAFPYGKDGQLDLSRVVICQGDPHKDLAAPLTSTRMDKALDTPAEQSYQRFDQSTQAMEIRQQETHPHNLMAGQSSQERAMPMQ